MRRPVCTAARASLTRSGPRAASVASRSSDRNVSPQNCSRPVASASGGHDFEDDLGHAEERLLHLTPVSRRALADAAQLEPLLGERVDRAIEIGGEHDEVVDRDDAVRVRRRRRGYRRSRTTSAGRRSTSGTGATQRPRRDARHPGRRSRRIVTVPTTTRLSASDGEPGGTPAVGSHRPPRARRWWASRVTRRAELPRQERQHVGELVGLLRERLAGAVAGAVLLPQQDRMLVAARRSPTAARRPSCGRGAGRRGCRPRPR